MSKTVWTDPTLTPNVTKAKAVHVTEMRTAINNIEETYVRNTDTRLTNARTPTAHKSSHAAGGSDALTPADIGAATSGHGHSAVTTSVNGFMSATDKVKLNALYPIQSGGKTYRWGIENGLVYLEEVIS